MKNCNADTKFENVEMSEMVGDKVAQVLECVTTKPAAFRFRMCDVLIFKDGKKVAERVGALTQKKQLQDWINGSI